MKKITISILLIGALMAGSTVYAKMGLGFGLWLGNTSITQDYTGTYWGTARTAYWTDTREALWSTARNADIP
jgi:hypothetical protein